MTFERNRLFDVTRSANFQHELVTDSSRDDIDLSRRQSNVVNNRLCGLPLTQKD